jgi:hypothetical protein
VPTSSCANGDSRVPTVSILSVGDPGLSTEEPLKTFTETSFPALTAAPTSTDSSTGCPRRISEPPDAGTKRSRPGFC